MTASGAPRSYTCAETMAHVDEFIDQELSPHECDRIDQHLAVCPPCRARYARNIAVKAMVRRACQCDAVPDDVRVKVLTRISQLRVSVEQATFSSLTVEVRTSTPVADPARGLDF